ncbi:MAG: transglutaminase domain-containing protein [Chloroflexi bacterium]|nr:transglutaminase domain-containing protein [Chloroflexota bacterium]
MSLSHYQYRYDASSETREKETDWFLYLLLLAAVLCLPLVVQATAWFPEKDRLIWPALWAMLTGIVLAKSKAPGWLAWILSLILGTEYSLQFAGHILPGLDILVDDSVRAVGWAARMVRGNWALLQPWPFERTARILWERGSTMANNLTNWFQAVQTGTETRDVTFLLIGIVLLTWILVFNAAFALLRSRKAFIALLPLGAAVVANVSFTDIGMSYVHFYLGVTLFTLVRANVQRMESFWRRLHLDFSPELRRDATVAGGALSIVVLVMALIIPYMTYADAVWLFWDNFGPKLMEFYKDLDKAFAGRNPVPSPTPGKGRGLLPHRIGGEGTLGDDVVLLVQTSDPPPPLDEELEMLSGVDPSVFITKRYWRERTYDEYTGHGWDVGNRDTRRVRADEAWTEVNYPHDVVTQTIEVIQDNAGLAFTVNEPIKIVDADYQVIARGPGDLAAIEVNTDMYTVVSMAPNPTEQQLQEAEGPYPDWVSQRFLSLPRSLPDRVRQEAERVVAAAGAKTRYEKARAIESYIRSFIYDLDVEPPSLDRDFVDYFLFEAQRGYCDYSASAMVVMLRAVGVAARYASGYNMGQYDHTLGAWVVREENAHAWAEVYFPGLGWVEFEPTPTQYIFDRGGSLYGSLSASGLTPLEKAPKRSLPPLWVWGVGLLLIVLFVVIWPPRYIRRRQTPPREVVWQTYDKLVRRARWAGLAPFGGQTPREYLRALAHEMERRADFAGAAAAEVSVLENAYLRARYSSAEISEEEGLRVQGAWRRLRGMLLRLMFVRPSTEPSRAL